MLNYLREYEAEYKRLGAQGFVRAYPWPVLVVTGIGGEVQDGNLSRSGTMTAVGGDYVEECALAGRVFPVVKGRNSAPGPVTIGRCADNDLVIPEYTMSKKHCILALVDGEYRLTDLGTRNGTRVNDVMLTALRPHRLQGEERLRMGRLALVFHLPSGFGEFFQRRA